MVRGRRCGDIDDSTRLVLRKAGVVRSGLAGTDARRRRAKPPDLVVGIWSVVTLTAFRRERRFRPRTPSGEGVDDDRREEDQPGRDELPLDREAQQVETVVDGPYDQSAQDAVEDPAAATEEAGATGDRRGGGIEDELASIDVGIRAALAKGLSSRGAFADATMTE
jgi:hypothetical protein